MSPLYLDCNATTPIEPAIVGEMMRYFVEEFGNPGSRTHEYGVRAKRAVQEAREQVARLVKAQREDVIFTSGATESNNLALLGLAEWGRKSGRKHVISSRLEHKAVLEPLERLAQGGFEVTWLRPSAEGFVEPEALREALRPDTLLVSMMHVNNETGIVQPLEAMAEVLGGHPAYFHVDAAQGFGKEVGPLQNTRLDLISVSGHKIYGPKGVGALVVRRRGYERLPLEPLMVGGGQERGLRPGTLPTPLIVGLGMAAELAERDGEARRKRCLALRAQLISALEPLKPVWVGSQGRRLYNTLSLRLPGLDSEAVMVALKGEVSCSNGSACTSSSYKPSHVLLAMGLTEEEAQETFRLSWCHLTPDLEGAALSRGLQHLR